MEAVPKNWQMKEAPDTGYAWVVAAAACLINFIMAGLGRMSGILYVAFIDNFQVTRKEATKPFTIRSSLKNLLGPVVGILGQQYGVRAVAIAGGAMGTVSAFSCYFAPNMMWITIIWGLINGIGTALASTLLQVAIGQYFDKYKSTASGIGFSGVCVSSFIFPVLFEYLLHTYGVHGTFLIMAGIIMHVLPAAMILRRPAWMNNSLQKTAVHLHKKDVSENSGNVAFPREGFRPPDDTGPLDSLSNRKTTHEPTATASEPQSNKCANSRGPEEISEIIIDESILHETAHNVAKESNFYRHDQQVVLAHDHDRQEVVAKVEMSQSEKHEIGGGFSTHIKTSIKLYTNPFFLLLSFCRVIHFCTFIPVVTVIVDFGMDKGLLEEDGKYVIAALSLGELIGRLCLGWITDRGFVSLPRFMLVVMVLQGAATSSLPLLRGMPAILIMVTFFGMLEGSLFVRHPVLLSKYMGKNKQSLSMGSMNFLAGLLGFALPSFIGYFRDTLGSYDHMFYITGALGCTIGMVWILEPYFLKISKE